MMAELLGPVPVEGFALDRFADVLDIFGRTVAAQGRGGAALAIYHQGQAVVDLVAGDYAVDTAQLVFSVSKSITAIAAAIAHDEGLLDLDAPLSDYWPAFDRPSTSAVTARMVLSHRSGLAATDRVLSFEEMLAGEDEAAVEVQEPYWEPDTAHGYHAFTFGTLMTGVFRRTLGTSVGAFVDERLAKPLGLELWIGLPDEQFARVAPIVYDSPRMTTGRAEFLAMSPIPPSSTGRLSAIMDIYNHPDLLRIGWPSSSGVATARDLARLYASTLGPVDGTRVLNEVVRNRMIASRSNGMDRVLGVVSHFGSGMQRPFPMFPLLGSESYGHEAAGGSAAFADIQHDIAVGFTTNVYPANSGASSGFLALLPVLLHTLTNY